MVDVDVVMITKDEAANLPFSLPTVVGWAKNVFVVDSGSSDDTVELAKRLGAEVVHHDWPGYAQQKNWALDNLPLTASWTLILDADEAMLPELRLEIQELTKRPLDEVREAGFLVNRYFIFLGQRIRHCGYYPSYNLRLFKRGKARYEERPVHEHMLVDGPTGTLRGHLEHYDRRGLEAYMEKHNRYSTLEARAIVEQAKRAVDALPASLFGTQMERRRWLKAKVYPRLPAKWAFRFAFMYIARLGFLDGLNGLRFCLFMSAYELLIELKMVELQIAETESAPISDIVRARNGSNR